MLSTPFSKAASAFSEALSHIPQDDLPTDFIQTVTQELDLLRSDSASLAFGIEPGEPILLWQSNLAFGATSVWQHGWNRDHPAEAILIDMQRTAQQESRLLHTAFDYMHERDCYVVGQMVRLLEQLDRPIPNQLREFLNGQTGSVERPSP